MAGVDLAIRAGRDGDEVLAARVHDDQGDPRRPGHRDDAVEIDALGRERCPRLAAHVVRPDRPDECDPGAESGRRSRLVAPLAARVSCNVAPGDRLAGHGQPERGDHEVDVDRSDHEHASAWHCRLWPIGPPGRGQSLPRRSSRTSAGRPPGCGASRSGPCVRRAAAPSAVRVAARPSGGARSRAAPRPAVVGSRSGRCSNGSAVPRTRPRLRALRHRHDTVRDGVGHGRRRRDATDRANGRRDVRRADDRGRLRRQAVHGPGAGTARGPDHHVVRRPRRGPPRGDARPGRRGDAAPDDVRRHPDRGAGRLAGPGARPFDPRRDRRRDPGGGAPGRRPGSRAAGLHDLRGCPSDDRPGRILERRRSRRRGAAAVRRRPDRAVRRAPPAMLDLAPSTDDGRPA